MPPSSGDPTISPGSESGASAFFGRAQGSLAGHESGSWMDPMFKDLPPLADLPCLGERYQDLQFLGEGATAKVFRATDTLLLRNVALKLMKNPMGATLQEGRAQARIEHPNVCRIYEVGQGYLVMELIEGATLHQLQGGLNIAQKVALVRDVARGVHAAHQRGLVHLDLKPGNILVKWAEQEEFHPVVGDFGMILDGGPRADGRCPQGTPPYSSPEQLRGDADQVDQRSDIYSLGMVLYVILAGAHPFGDCPPEALPEATQRRPPRPLRELNAGVPVDLARIVHKSIEKEPGARYADARVLALDLDRFLQDQAVVAMENSHLYLAIKWFRRNRGLALIAFLGVAATLTVAIPLLRANRRILRQENWAHHFQTLVEDLRISIDRAYRKPLHDVEPELAAAQLVLQEIRDEMAAHPEAQGPGNLAIGQASILLGARDPMTLSHFQKAWDLGFRSESSRAWLAYALVRAYRTDIQVPHSLWDKRDDPTCADLQERARQLVAGRRNTEEFLISHLLDVSDLAARKLKGTEEALRVARDFRNRRPDDLDGMLEEAQVLCDRAEALHGTAQSGNPGAFSPEELLGEAEQVLTRARVLAPSHPEIHRALGRVWACRDRVLPGSVQERGRRQAEAFACLDRGLVSSPTHWRLQRDRLNLLCTQGLQLDLIEGHPPGEATWRKLWKEWEASLSAPRKRSPAGWALEMVHCLAQFRRYGHSNRRRLEETLRFLTLHGSNPKLDIRTWILCFPTLGELMTEEGMDLSPLLDLWRYHHATRPGPTDRYSALGMGLLDLERRPPGAPEIQALVDHLGAGFLDQKGQGTEDEFFELAVLVARARYLDTPGAWQALEANLPRLSARWNQEERRMCLPSLAEANLLLARRRLETGADPAPFPAQAKCMVDAMAEKVEPNRIQNWYRAELSLVEVLRPGTDPADPGFVRGLAQCRAALSAADPATEPVPQLGVLSGMHALPVRRSRILRIQAELRLRQAELQRGPSLRAHALRCALEDFRSLRRCYPWTAQDLAPLEARCRALAPPRTQGRPWPVPPPLSFPGSTS